MNKNINLIVYTIILNWNNIEDTAETIECLLNQNYKYQKIILIDNNSEEHVYRSLLDTFPQIIHIRNNENLGYTGGNNVGIKYALKNNADIIILANNDLYIDNNSLISKMVDEFVFYKQNIFLLGPSLNFYNNKNQVQEAGTIIFKSNINKYKVNDFTPEDLIISENIRYFDGVPGAFMAIKKEVFTQIGLLDEKIFMYGDETDFCYRAWTKNMSSAVDNSLIVYHKGGGVKSRLSPRITYYKTRNTLYFLLKHKHTIKNYRYFILQFHYFFLSNLWLLIKSKERNKELINASIKGLTDGWMKRMGKRF